MRPIPETSNFVGIIVTPRVSQMCNMSEKSEKAGSSVPFCPRLIENRFVTERDSLTLLFWQFYSFLLL